MSDDSVEPTTVSTEAISTGPPAVETMQASNVDGATSQGSGNGVEPSNAQGSSRQAREEDENHRHPPTSVRAPETLSQLADDQITDRIDTLIVQVDRLKNPSPLVISTCHGMCRKIHDELTRRLENSDTDRFGDILAQIGALDTAVSKLESELVKRIKERKGLDVPITIIRKVFGDGEIEHHPTESSGNDLRMHRTLQPAPMLPIEVVHLDTTEQNDKRLENQRSTIAEEHRIVPQPESPAAVPSPANGLDRANMQVQMHQPPQLPALMDASSDAGSVNTRSISSRNGAFSITTAIENHDQRIGLTSQNDMAVNQISHEMTLEVEQGIRCSRQPGQCDALEWKLKSRVYTRPFRGELLDWPTFWGDFRGDIHLNPKLTIIAKFDILVERIRDAPYRTIRAYKARREAGYPQALRALLAMYHRPQDIRAQIIAQYAHYQPITNSDDHSATLELINALRETHGILDLLATEEWFYDNSLLVPVYRLLPPEVKRLVSAEGRMTYPAAFQLLERHLMGLSRGRTLLGQDLLNTQEETEVQVEKKPTPTTRRRGAALVITPANGQGERLANCVLCSSNLHKVMNCPTYPTGRERSDRAKSLGLCFRCLSNQHFSRQCQYQQKCSRCGRTHRTEMCLSIGRKTPSTPAQTTTRNEVALRPTAPLAPATVQLNNVPSVNPAAPRTYSLVRESNEVVPVSAAYTTYGQLGRVYLPVVPGQLSGGRKIGTVNILLDGAATNCFISRRKVNELGLSARKIDPFFVNGFGQTQTSINMEVEIGLHGLTGQFVGKLSVFVTPFAMGVPITRPSDNVKRLLNEKQISYIVDQLLPASEVDLLIGAPYLHTIETG